MRESFFKYPSTPHLALLEGVSAREDKVLSGSEREEFLRHPLVVEEKVDGANLGLSFDPQGNLRAQNRGTLVELPGTGQWRELGTWLSSRTDVLFDMLTDRLILFGEWCYARHSVRYDRLPDWFLGFDLYDREERRFLSCRRRNELLEQAGVIPVPEVARGIFTLGSLREFFVKSQISEGPAEGVYLRIDEGAWLARRAKLVRPAFVQSMEAHWSRGRIVTNRLLGDPKDVEGRSSSWASRGRCPDPDGARPGRDDPEHRSGADRAARRNCRRFAPMFRIDRDTSQGEEGTG